MERMQSAVALFIGFLAFHMGGHVAAQAGFVGTSGSHFVLNGNPIYVNGFNAYWLMYMASDPSQRDKVSSVFKQASSYGLTVARTWAFSDGGYRALQYSPGSYNEEMFKGLDFVVSEAKKYGIYLILSLANNYENYGGRHQYVQWARDQGQYLSSDDDFYTNPVVKGYYKNHIKAILTRVNSFTGIAYKDDPTIFSWELINEPRCQSDLSGRTLQGWIEEMADYLKSIDSKHLLEVGLEGFYGESTPSRKQYNPGYGVGTDFITNNQVAGIDFATIHAYPDQWLSGSSSEQDQLNFLYNWVQSHIDDSNYELRKPLLFTEFGKSSKDSGFTQTERENLYQSVYNSIYTSARSGGAGGGALFWQMLAEGMDDLRDGYEIIVNEDPTTANLIAEQSHKLSGLNRMFARMTANRKMKGLVH
ncbi:mannan endo-1,4-beta-mannosidase 1-like [Nymphaea colorata]|nr:mannan endo-1,4-beta-mannosidase 1-like [Nymphaea colorata]XP_031484688.1 mannan endo-1,4-beta-mannosidase 1-like [Nymphaea colorata]